MRTCGIFARSATYARPLSAFPSASGNSPFAVLNSGDSRISRRLTISGCGFGISTPTAPFPGMGATMRTLLAFIARARSASRFAIRLTFTPGAGITSNCVTIGPVVRPPSSLSTLNVFSFSIKIRPNSSNSRCMVEVSRPAGSESRSIGGTSCSDRSPSLGSVSPPSSDSSSRSPSSSASTSSASDASTSGSASGSGSSSGSSSGCPSSTSSSASFSGSLSHSGSIPARSLACSCSAARSTFANARASAISLPFPASTLAVRPAASPPAITPRPIERRGFQLSVPTDNATTPTPVTINAPIHPTRFTSGLPTFVPSHPAALGSDDSTHTQTGARSRSPALKIVRRGVQYSESQPPKRRPEKTRSTGTRKADPPKKTVKSVPKVAPTSPTMFPEGNQSPPRSPSKDTGRRDRKKNSARANRATAKISRCCSRVSIRAGVPAYVARGAAHDAFEFPVPGSRSGQCDGVIVHHGDDVVPVQLSTNVQVIRQADVHEIST